MIGWRGVLAVWAGGLAVAAGSASPPAASQEAAAWPVRFIDVAREAGLTQPITYGDEARKAKWLVLAGRLATMPEPDRQRIQQRMAEWARLSPARLVDIRFIA